MHGSKKKELVDLDVENVMAEDRMQTADGCCEE